MAKDNNHVLYFSLLILLLLLIMLFQAYNSKCKFVSQERFSDKISKSVADVYNEQTSMQAPMNSDPSMSAPNDPYGMDSYTPVTSNELPQMQQQGSAPAVDANTSCFPRDNLTAQDLLPKEALENSKWANMNPSTGGSINDKNLLNADWTVGINTVQNSLRNANLQLRSEPPNPQKPVSPWMISTIGPDTNRRDLEIGSQPYWS